MVNQHLMSERHACTLVGLSRDTYRHVGHTSVLNVELRDRIVQTAHTRRRWGYRMIHDVLRPQYPGINHKRVYRMGVLVRGSSFMEPAPCWTADTTRYTYTYGKCETNFA